MTFIRRAGLALAAIGAIVLLAIALGRALRVKETFAPEDVSAIAARMSSIRAASNAEDPAPEEEDEEDDDEDEEDPKRNVEPRDPDEPEDIDAEFGGIALALFKAKPEAFDRLAEHFDSETAHDLDRLEADMASFCVGVTA